MSSPFIGEVRIFGGNFAPQGWATCDGQLLPISQNSALFSLLGTTYGGDGQATFALPDLRGRIPVHTGSNSASSYVLGEAVGSETITLTTAQMPAHSHAPATSATVGSAASPARAYFASSSAGEFVTGPANTPMASGLVGSAGANQPHDNLMPYLTLNFIIALEGIYPSSS